MHRWSFFLFLSGFLVTFLNPAAVVAQTKAQRAATEAFSQCRDMEQYGDATACWRRWLEKHREVGSEAEVMVAEERSARAGTEKKPPTAPPPEEPEEEPSPDEAEPSEEAVIEPPPEEPTEEEEEDGEEQAKPVAPIAIRADGPDLCASAKADPKANRFTRARVVIFGISKADSLEENDALRGTEPERHLNEAFLAHFPSDRFLNVTTTLAGDPGWPSTEQLTVESVTQHVSSRAEAGDTATFLGKAVGCADYLAFTTLGNITVQPGSTPAGVEIELSAKMAIFRVQGAQGKRLAVLEAAVPSLFDRAEDTAAQSAAASMNSATSSIDSANQLAANAERLADTAVGAANAVGDAAKAASEGEVPEEVGAGANSECAEGDDCEGDSSPLIEKPSLAGTHERLGAVCMTAQQETDAERKKTKLIACEVRVRGYMLARSLQDSSLDVPGWQLTAPLIRVGDRFGIPLGQEEGLDVGDSFVVLDQNGNRVAYFKVVDVGPGGKEGENAPSEVALRLGEAPEQATLSEYRMIGLGLQVHGAAAYALGAQPHAFPLLLDIGNDGVEEQQTFRIPSLMFGGGGALSYDLSGLLSLPEFSVRAGGEYLTGSGRSTQATQIATELVFEKGFYLGSRLSFYAGIGGTFSLLTLKSVPEFDQLQLADGGVIDGTIVTMSGMRFGGAALLGFEFLLSPRFALRLEGNARLNLSEQGYESPQPATSLCPTVPVDSLECWAFDTRQDSWRAVGGRLGAKVMF